MTPEREATDSPTTRPPVDGDTLRAARRFLDEIGTRYAIRDAYLFGSRARGTHEPDSDADVAVILRGEAGNRGAAIIDMAGVSVDVMMDHDILIQAMPLWEDEFDRPEMCSNPALIRNILRDGRRL